jgi:hypothetical protein
MGYASAGRRENRRRRPQMIDHKGPCAVKMKRLTERDEYGNADIIGVDSADLQENLEFEQLNLVTCALNQLAYYEESELEAGAKGPVYCPACKCKNNPSDGGCPEAFDCDGLNWLSEHGYMDFENDKTLPMCPMFRPDYSRENELEAENAALIKELAQYKRAYNMACWNVDWDFLVEPVNFTGYSDPVEALKHHFLSQAKEGEK